MLVVLFLAILVGGYFLMMREKNSNINETPGSVTTITGGQLPSAGGGDDSGANINRESGENKTVLSNQEMNREEATSKAKFFVEMMGSYSPEAMFQNVIDLKPYMTSQMKEWADNFVERNSADMTNNKERVTTKAVNVRVLSEAGDKIGMIVYARREKMIGEDIQMTNEEVSVEMVMINNNWYVNKMVWQ